jgi:integrase/recombinase XerD
MRASMAESIRIPTREDGPFHNLKPEYARHTLDAALGSGLITDEDARLIEEFVAELRATEGIGVSRSNKITTCLTLWRRFIGPYTGNTIVDVQQGIEKIRNAKHEGRAYSQNTIRDYISFLKRFYRWLIENNRSTIPLDRINKIKPPGWATMTTNGESLLTEEEILAMIKACASSRDRALVGVLYESGCRIGEICRLTWSQVRFDSYGASLNVKSKTEKPRYIRISASAPLLAQWRADCSRFDIRDESLVFYSARKQPLRHAGVAKQLRVIADRAGIRKHIHPHLFRHSRVTNLLKQGCSEAVLKQMCWGHPGTKMLSIYSHLTNDDVDRAVLELNGIRVTEPRSEHSMAAQQCMRCQSINPPNTDFCATCGLPLNEAAVADLREVMEFIDNHPRRAELLRAVPVQG